MERQLEMTTNQQKSVQQLYEDARSTQRIKSATTMPDYKDIKDGLKKRKARKFKTPTFTNVQQVICDICRRLFSKDYMWNHFETVEVRTNNNVEGDNLKMKCYIVVLLIQIWTKRLSY